MGSSLDCGAVSEEMMVRGFSSSETRATSLLLKESLDQPAGLLRPRASGALQVRFRVEPLPEQHLAMNHPEVVDER